MSHSKSLAVVTPIYKPFDKLTAEELLSLKSSCVKLFEHPHILVAPAAMDLAGYEKFYSLYGLNVQVVTFEARYFKSVKGYNDLLKSVDFYQAFKNYTYILIFQTDAYVFKDEFNYWCEKSLDYIGAPWLEKPGPGSIGYKFIGVGNGGFSNHGF